MITVDTLFVYLSSFLVILSVTSGKRELPSFVKVCNRHDPNLNECIKSSILGIQPHLADGIPEMKIPAFDPLHVKEFVLSNQGVELRSIDLDFVQFDKFELKSVHLNWKRCHATLEAFYFAIPMRGNLKTKGSLLGISIDGMSGNYTANWSTVNMNPEMNCIILRRKGKEYLRFKDINLRLKIGGANVKFNLFDTKQENDNFNNILNLNMASLIEVFEPIVSTALGEVVLAEARAAFESFPLDILLPE